jgi:HK97 family phage major capsid protein
MDLYEKRATLVEQATALAESDELTPEQEASFDSLTATVEQIDKQIKRQSKATALIASGKASQGRLTASAGAAATKAVEDAFVDEDTGIDLSGPLTQADVRVLGERLLDSPTFGFKTQTEFYTEVWKWGTPGVSSDDERMKVLSAASGASQGTGADLGFLVPDEFRDSIWDGIHNDVNSLVSETDQYTVVGESLTLLANAEKSRATGSRHGGIRGYWIAEAAQMTSSTPKLRKVRIEPHELAVFSYVTDRLLRNGGPAVEQYVTRAAIEELSFLIGDSIVNGTGVGKPKGILNSTCRVTQAAISGQGTSTLVAGNFYDMYSRMLPRAIPGAKWLINIDTMPQIMRLKDDEGRLIWLQDMRLNNAPFGTILGLPVQPTEYNATLGTEGDVILANLNYYLTGTRGGVRSGQSIHLRFDYNETAFRFLTEVDGQPWLASAITPFKGSATLSAFVTLNSTRT